MERADTRHTADASKAWLSHRDAAAYLGLSVLELANLVELGTLRMHTREHHVGYLRGEIEKFRTLALCPPCRNHLVLTGRRLNKCSGCHHEVKPSTKVPPAAGAGPGG